MSKAKVSVTLRSDPQGYVEDYLLLLNGMLKLTSTELQVLAAFINYDSTVCASKSARKVVSERLKMKNVAVLNNYVKALKDKKCIYKDRMGLYRYNGLVSPKEPISSIEFIFNSIDD
jgi:hypothetical protein